MQNENIPKCISHMIACFDVSPMLNDKFTSLEHIGGIIRQFIILKNQLAMDTKTLTLSVICKILYTYERSLRISGNSRNKFGCLHSAEHIELYFYMLNKLSNDKYKSLNNMKYFVFITSVVIPIVLFKLYNYHILHTYKASLPSWFDYSISHIMDQKVNRNYNSNPYNHPYTYITKIFSPLLSWNIQTWDIITNQLASIVRKLKRDNINPDFCVGIKTGGALCVKYISDALNCKRFYLNCKTWSGNTFIEDWTHAINMAYDYERYLKNTASCAVSEFTKLPKHKKKYTILLFDDTVSSGKSMYATRDYLYKKYPDAIIKTCALIIPNESKIMVDYYESKSNVPILWPWGCELD